jgi:hypothetical protein
MKKIISFKTKPDGNNLFSSFLNLYGTIRFFALTILMLSSLGIAAQKTNVYSANEVTSKPPSTQKCPFKLSTKNNIESVNKDGRIYFIEIQNNSNDDMGIDLTVINANSGKNPDESDSKQNVNLVAKLFNEDGTEIIGKLKLKSNEFRKFQVNVTVPSGTPFGYWNNLLVSATSDKCKENTQSLMLFTFIPNPDER